MTKEDIKIGESFRYVNMIFIVKEKTDLGVKFEYEGKVYFREYVDIEKV